ncbi:hypothetical protein GCM10020358_03860 [Amorphoplanes nipponensis]|uniref:Uncharacterized protein n=1 Tax=Actinoplanes nipponensis TaxID=135950 RepID=A0A919JKU4_9ACTN|nr:hypothetical protein Ani05nite_61970 [Actinoplanes nipponensis]
MPTVNDAARITTRDGAGWRTCGGCGLLAALPPAADQCPGCDRPTATDARPAPDVWEIAHRYAETVGRIQAWVDMAHRSDAERLDNIRQFLADLDRFHAARRKGAGECR